MSPLASTLRTTFAEGRRRVLADDGTCWLNIGDSYGRAMLERLARVTVRRMKNGVNKIVRRLAPGQQSEPRHTPENKAPTCGFTVGTAGFEQATSGL
jgi:hypothetical protein